MACIPFVALVVASFVFLAGSDHAACGSTHGRNEMRYSMTINTLLAVGLVWPAPSFAVDNRIFSMVPSSSACMPGARGRVTVATPKNQIMHVEITGLPANTEFDLFVIQKPTPKFGMSWYQGDITTDSKGIGVGDFAGVFSQETFTVAPGVEQAPVVFGGPFPDASSNPQTAPVQMYHLGVWFASPSAAAAAGCPSTVTPFNGEHNAGVQVLNTSNFTDLAGPLRVIH
jgi:hypothetical protein